MQTNPLKLEGVIVADPTEKTEGEEYLPLWETTFTNMRALCPQNYTVVCRNKWMPEPTPINSLIWCPPPPHTRLSFITHFPNGRPLPYVDPVGWPYPSPLPVEGACLNTGLWNMNIMHIKPWASEAKSIESSQVSNNDSCVTFKWVTRRVNACWASRLETCCDA